MKTYDIARLAALAFFIIGLFLIVVAAILQRSSHKRAMARLDLATQASKPPIANVPTRRFDLSPPNQTNEFWTTIPPGPPFVLSEDALQLDIVFPERWASVKDARFATSAVMRTDFRPIVTETNGQFEIRFVAPDAGKEAVK